MFISPNFKQKLRKKLISQSWENGAADIENGAQTNEQRAELIVSFHRDGGPETATKMIPLFFRRRSTYLQEKSDRHSFSEN